MVQALAQLATATGSRRLGVLVKRKELVKKNGEWVEAYVDKGPAKPSTMSVHRDATPHRRRDGKRGTHRVI